MIASRSSLAIGGEPTSRCSSPGPVIRICFIFSFRYYSTYTPTLDPLLLMCRLAVVVLPLSFSCVGLRDLENIQAPLVPLGVHLD
jgi:hypothetical protein